MAILWAVYREDSNGKRTTIGENGVFTTSGGEKIQVWDLETETQAEKICERIYASHSHPDNVEYFPVDYVEGKMLESFANWNIEMLG